MFFYRLVEDNFDGTEECVLICSKDKYSFEEFSNLVFEVMSPNKNDEDYIDENTYRNIYQIADVLVYENDFDYVSCEVSLSI